MKFRGILLVYGNEVVPHAGTWIEITNQIQTRWRVTVVPHAGTWIEILRLAQFLRT